jgi:chemotaxis protein MotB
MSATTDNKGVQPIIIKKVIKKGGHGHHGGAWKVAYADFVTAMMALFIVLWLLQQADTKTKQEIAQYFRQPGVAPGGALIGTQKGEAVAHAQLLEGPDFAPPSVDEGGREQQALESEAKAIKASLEKLAKESPEFAELEKDVLVEVTTEGLMIQVVDKGQSMLFDTSSATLKPALVAFLKRLAAQLAKLPNVIQIGGHTDAHTYPSGSGTNNWDLSYARAAAARKVLETSGLREGQVTRLLAYGDTTPLNKKDPDAPENRRLSILARRAKR